MSCISDHDYVQKQKKIVKGMNWTDEETKVFLEIFLDKKIISLLDGKKFKHLDIYKSLEKDMLSRGFLKTAQQMKLKMTKLKQLYFKCKRDNQTSGSDRKYFQFFNELDAIYGDRPNVTVPNSEDGIDTGNEPGMDESAEMGEAFEEVLVNDIPVDFQIESTPPEIVYADENAPAVDSTEKKNREKSKPRKKGKKSYTDQVEEIQKNTMKVLSEFCQNQTQLTADLIRTENEKQRDWELELLRREHNFQQSQMEMLLRTIQFQQLPPIPYQSYVPHMKYHAGSSDSSEANPIYLSQVPSTSKVSSFPGHSTASTSEVKDLMDSSDDSSSEEN